MGLCRCLETLPQAAHPLVLCAHHPDLTATGVLSIHTSALRSSCDMPLTIGRASRAAQKIFAAASTVTSLRSLDITTSARTSWSESTVASYSNALAHFQELSALALDGGVCSPSVVAATAAALPTLFSLSLIHI